MPRSLIWDNEQGSSEKVVIFSVFSHCVTIIQIRENVFDQIPLASFVGSGEDKSPECWICYDGDRDDVGAMIYPCNCKGDVSAVHHDCLRRWLVEVSSNLEFESLLI